MRWPWTKPEPEPPTVTVETHGRWIRAGRPPYQWFAELPADQQEALAQVGDAHDIDRAIAIGYAVRDPEAAEKGIAAAAGDLDAEADLVQRLAARAVEKMLGSRSQPTAPAPTAQPPSMGGLAARRQGRQEQEQAGRDRGRSFLGRAPEPQETVAP